MKLRKIAGVLVIAGMLIVMSVFTAGAANANIKAVVNSGNVNVRSGAGTNTAVIGNLSKKTSITLVSNKLYSKDWYHIKTSDGKTGYIHKDYVKINKNQLYIAPTATAYKGYTYTYRLTNTTGSAVKWKSSDKKLATVSSKGVVTCLKKGTVNITATAGKKKIVSKIKIVNAEVSLSQTQVEAFTDEKVTLNATCPKDVTFKSSDKSIATVSSKGGVTGLSEGTVTITAKSKSGCKAQCTITFKKRKIVLSTYKSTIYKDCYAQMNAANGLNGYTYTSSNPNILTITNDGLMYAVGEGTATVTCTSGDLKTTKKIKVVTGSNVNLSHDKGSVNKDMTLYIKSSTANVKWRSSNEDVATVDGGFVFGKKKGTAVISAYTSKGESTCLVTVTDARPIRFVYTSENSVLPDKSVTLYAITDTTRTNVKFKLIAPDDTSVWITNTSKKTENSRYIWSASTKLTKAGVYRVEAYSRTKNNSAYESGVSGYSTVFLNSASSRKTMDLGQRRATTALINDIASFEGFLSTVTPDNLAGGIPTVGYGRVIYSGSSFYNGMTKSEAYAFLVNTVNESGFTSQVNKFLTENKIKFNQRQFDALVDFSYNLGAYAITNHEELSSLLLDTYGKASNERRGFVNDLNVTLKKGAASSYATIKYLTAGDDVILVSDEAYNDDWYKIKLSDGTTGYVDKSKITKRTVNTAQRNLNNLSFSKYCENFLPYHHASGNCYYGLLYRRIDEAEMFFFGDYAANGKENNFEISYICGKNSSFKIG